MNADFDTSKQVVVITLVVVAVMIVASVGFASLSENPLAPDVTLNVRDDPDEYNLRQEGVFGVIVIDHEGGDTIDIGETELLIGNRNSGFRLNQTNNWTAEPTNATFALRVGGEPVRANDRFGPRDRIRVVRTTGTLDFSGSFEIRVRLFHLPSQRTLVDSQVTVG
jgi:hypothetical protein